MFGVVILPLHFGRGLFYYSNFNCFNIGEEETNLILRSSHSNLWLFLKICKCYNFKQTKSPLQLHQIVLLFIRSHCRRCKLRSKLLHRCILRNIMTSFTIQLRCKTPLIFGIFSITLSICCCHIFIYYPTKPLWNCCKRKSDLLFPML